VSLCSRAVVAAAVGVVDMFIVDLSMMGVEVFCSWGFASCEMKWKSRRIQFCESEKIVFIYVTLSGEHSLPTASSEV
jgi:hypothetical protein